MEARVKLKLKDYAIGEIVCEYIERTGMITLSNNEDDDEFIDFYFSQHQREQLGAFIKDVIQTYG